MAWSCSWWFPAGPWQAADTITVGRPNRGKRRNVKAARKAARRNRR